MNDHKSCYGKMFPDVLPPVDTGVHSGKAFSFSIESIGLARSSRKVNVNTQEWDDCRNCVEFEDCYKLSTALLALQSAIREA